MPANPTWWPSPSPSCSGPSRLPWFSCSSQVRPHSVQNGCWCDGMAPLSGNPVAARQRVAATRRHRSSSHGLGWVGSSIKSPNPSAVSTCWYFTTFKKTYMRLVNTRSPVFNRSATSRVAAADCPKVPPPLFALPTRTANSNSLPPLCWMQLAAASPTLPVADGHHSGLPHIHRRHQLAVAALWGANLA